MATLGELQNKRVNFVWIGAGSISALEAFNVLSWASCGWDVTIYRHPGPNVHAGEIFPAAFRQPIAATQRVTVDTVMAAATPPTQTMPLQRELLLRWLGAQLTGTVPYAVGDLTKAYIAGTRTGIVLDLKIGPSPQVNAFPADPFVNNFIGASRAGGQTVENQCMGSFVQNLTDVFGAAYEAGGGAASKFKGVELDEKFDGDNVFPGLTACHVKAWETAKVNSKKIGVDVVTYLPSTARKAALSDFVELQGRFKKDFKISSVTELPDLVRNGGDGWSSSAQVNSGPFRVYQIAGFYNWREGRYDSAKWGNKGSVARTLYIEHVMTNPRLQGPFTNLAGYADGIKPLVPQVIANLCQ